jgi:hypothetical protein
MRLGLYSKAKIKGGESVKLRAFILLALTVLAFATPVLVTLNVSAPKIHRASSDIIKNADSPVLPCGDPIEDPDFPHKH